MLLSEAFETYRRDYIVFKCQSKKTEESHLLAQRSIIDFLGDIELEELKFQQVRDWKEDLQKRMSLNTVRLYIIRLRTVIAFARLNGANCINEATIAVPKRHNTTIKFITPEEVQRLIDTAINGSELNIEWKRYRNAVIISLLYASGIRVSELCALNRQDLRPDGTFTVVGKGNKIRLCFYDDRTKELLDKYLSLRKDRHEALLISEISKKRLNAGAVQEVFRFVGKKAGISVYPHVMRHSFATNLLSSNTNLYYVSKFLGHSSTQTTEMYLHYVDEDLKSVYRDKHTIS